MSDPTGGYAFEPQIPLIQSSARTRIKVWKCCYRWTIENFTYCPRTTGQSLESPSFTVGPNSEQKWKLELYPDGIAVDSQGYISIFLKLVYSTESRTHARFEISLLNEVGRKMITKSDIGLFAPYGCRGWKDFVRREDLFRNSIEFSAANTVIVHCELSASIETRNLPGLDDIRLSVPRFHLPEKLLGLLHSGKFSDVLIATEGEEFRAHAAILAANSPKFFNMFRDEGPREPIRLNMKSYDPEIVSDLLDFMYAGRLPDFADIRAEKLLAASNEFALEELKRMVEDVLMTRVKIDSVAQYLLLSENHSARRLKEFCLDFIQKNVAAVLDSDGWKKAAAEKPRLVDEVATKLAISLSTP